MQSHKPRIRKAHGLWFCYSADRKMGCGYTPLEAYEEWAK